MGSSSDVGVVSNLSRRQFLVAAAGVAVSARIGGLSRPALAATSHNLPPLYINAVIEKLINWEFAAENLAAA